MQFLFQNILISSSRMLGRVDCNRTATEMSKHWEMYLQIIM